MLGLPTILSALLALVIASMMGPLLGRLATQWFSGRGLSNLLTEIRGAFLPYVITPLVAEISGWTTWVVIGLVVGTTQGISVGRWIARRTGEWSPTVLGGIALGRSRAALLSARATARGAVIGTFAVTFVQVVLLEALLTAMNMSQLNTGRTIGASLYDGAGAETLFVFLLGTGAIVVTEMATSWLFQRRPGASTK